MSDNRKSFDEAVANMSMSSSKYFQEYVFYLHLLSQCRLSFKDDMKAPAGVSFKNTHYILHINLEYFKTIPLKLRLGIIKHEMMHIADGHLLRVGDKDFLKYNYASDCALNQSIKRSHLPEGAIYPDNFPSEEASELWNETAEVYYSLLENMDEEEFKNKTQGQLGEGDGDNPSYTSSTDTHDTWLESDGDPVIQQEITKSMVEKAGNETIKARGNLPANYSQMIDNLTVRREVNWKQVLRRVVGHKRANKRKTLMRRDRRLPFFSWIKGKTKDRVFNLAVISDVSGSVGGEALISLWGEILSVCKTYDTPVTMVQVDTEPSVPEVLTKDSKTLERKSIGGTFLSPALGTLKEYNVNYNALVITTDGYLCTSDVEAFANLSMPVIWLIEETGQIMPEMNENGMIAIKLTKE